MGGGKKSKAPAAPDYAALQQSDALANRQTAQELTRWNRPTQIDALGNSLNWSQDGNGNWTQQVNLNPDVRQAQVQGLWGYRNAMADIEQQGGYNPISMGFANDAYNQAAWNGNFNAPASDLGKFDPNAYGSIGEFDRSQGDKVASDMYESAMSRLRPQQQQDTAAIDVKLRQQGLQPGTEAYDRAMKNMTTSQGDVNAKLGLDSTAAGYQAAQNIYNTNLGGQSQRFQQGLSGYGANMSKEQQDFDQARDLYTTNTDQDWKQAQMAMQIQQQQYNQNLQNYNLPYERAQVMAQLAQSAPGANFAGFGTATGYSPADMTGAAQAGYQAKMGASNAQAGKKNSMLGAGTSLGSAFLGSK